MRRLGMVTVTGTFLLALSGVARASEANTNTTSPPALPPLGLGLGDLSSLDAASPMHKALVATLAALSGTKLTHLHRTSIKAADVAVVAAKDDNDSDASTGEDSSGSSSEEDDGHTAEGSEAAEVSIAINHSFARKPLTPSRKTE